ncbi:preprotein translocase subunit SecY [Demequina capsici]|uniref:Protein translocase subunit SecY n=1 Tax=Demequina capsici TaxID=3075620 RepID=A0AA96F6E4_9MICO|nr:MULTISPECIES: preprotein translocase subunit SecY [unclassified Demequina]WNM24038.1 preprotein translocase subunit SecY [Demequina sp. OYTSA14]WNM26865.1 preprotein translocase subunit SecY [Demequina sp. PMTSA13]
MLSGFMSAFRTPDLRKKLLFTLGIIAVYRLGVAVPTPGIDYNAVQQCLTVTGGTTGAFAILNLFTGGALQHLSIFALGIMPYITASIIVQLLRVLIPRFETLYREGAEGQAKLTQYTRYITIGFAVLQSASYVTLARTGQFFPGCSYDIVPDDSWLRIAIMIITMTAGTVLIMWFGERISERGVGNGMSLLIFTSIAAGFPKVFGIVYAAGWGTLFAFSLVTVAVIAGVVFVEQSQRRIPVQYAKRVVGRRTLGGSSTYIPLKINMAGVIPVIFAASLLSLPTVILQFSGSNPPNWVVWMRDNIASSTSPWHIGLYILLIVFFAYFYTAITFNPEEVADNMKKYGGFIPGIRPGKPTADFLDYVLSRITAAGSLYLAIVALVPTVMFAVLKLSQSIPLGGTSVLILVGVGLDTVKRIESQLEQRHYEGFLK